jgi:MYXO-CTERM domain-containing protein
MDADSDDDGLLDGDEANPSDDHDGDGSINILDEDADDDGLFDGTEVGNDCSDADTDAAANTCIADADSGATTTVHLDDDTDDGGKIDGDEDLNKNGAVDGDDGDPLDPSDDGWCLVDADCGAIDSGMVCDMDDTHMCIPGCRGTDGNGCPSDEECSSMDDTIGTCEPISMGAGGMGGMGGSPAVGGSGGQPVVTPPPEPRLFAQGNGLFCAASPGTGGDDSSALLVLLGAAGLAASRRRRRRRVV